MTKEQIKNKIKESNKHLVNFTGVGNIVCRDTFNENNIILCIDGESTINKMMYCPICGKKIFNNNS